MNFVIDKILMKSSYRTLVTIILSNMIQIVGCVKPTTSFNDNFEEIECERKVGILKTSSRKSFLLINLCPNNSKWKGNDIKATLYRIQKNHGKWERVADANLYPDPTNTKWISTKLDMKNTDPRESLKYFYEIALTKQNNTKPDDICKTLPLYIPDNPKSSNMLALSEEDCVKNKIAPYDSENDTSWHKYFRNKMPSFEFDKNHLDLDIVKSPRDHSDTSSKLVLTTRINIHTYYNKYHLINVELQKIRISDFNENKKNIWSTITKKYFYASKISKISAVKLTMDLAADLESYYYRLSANNHRSLGGFDGYFTDLMEISTLSYEEYTMKYINSHANTTKHVVSPINTKNHIPSSSNDNKQSTASSNSTLKIPPTTSKKTQHPNSNIIWLGFGLFVLICVCYGLLYFYLKI